MPDPLVEELKERRTLSDKGFVLLLESKDASLGEELSKAAREVSEENFGRKVWLRALVEWSNVCRNDCLYCGIRKSNTGVVRYSLSEEEILSCCEKAWNEGLRTFVLQGGENPGGAEALVGVVSGIRSCWPEAAITLSLGELPPQLYGRLRKAGADRYLLRHETASPAHYRRLHPEGMSIEARIGCLRELRRLGYQTGTGMMVGSPWQDSAALLADIRFIEAFRPEMIGLGPFVPHRDTPLGSFPGGDAAMVLKLYSIFRLIFPRVMMPSTTALSAILPGGRVAGIRAGANVIMPNFTPRRQREEYALYEGKPLADVAEDMSAIKGELSSSGYVICFDRGDYTEN